MKATILFLSRYAAGRTPMAAALARSQAGAQIKILSAGVQLQPLNPHAVEAMEEWGVDLAAENRLAIEQVNLNQVDIIIALSDEVEKYCPVLPGTAVLIQWSCREISSIRSTEPEIWREIRNKLQLRIKELFSSGYIPAIISLKQHTEAILNHFPEPVLVHDMRRKIVAFNQAAETVTGYSRSEVLGRDCHEIFADGICGSHCLFCDDEVPYLENRDYSTKLQTKSGHTKQAEVSIIPLLDEKDQPQGILAVIRDVTEITHLRHRLRTVRSFHGIVGSDEKMQIIFDHIRDLAENDCSVLILGESGTGKELVAGAIHGESHRSGFPFVTVNCGALPEGILESELFGHVRGAFTGAVRDKKGRFELADRGTLFLDEVAELSPNMQVKLLRVLQEGAFERVGGEKTLHVDVRIISATNKDLRLMVRQGKFREDLFYRLCVVPVNLPPLRERRNDIPLLIEHFIPRFNKELNRNITSISPGALTRLLDYQWPGNIRELQNAIQYAFVKCKEAEIQLEHLPPEIFDGQTIRTSDTRPRRRKLTRPRVEEALKNTGGNKKQAARLLGVGRATLHRFLKEQS